MLAILKRELKAYFSSPIGYIFLAVFAVFAGLFFYAGCLTAQSANISAVFSSMFTIVLFLIPILTMRLLSEERKQKTDQTLLTGPINLFGVVMGKFLAALVLFALALSVTVVMMLVLAALGGAEWSVFFANFLGMLLMGAALISIGLFISSLTENQVIAAVASFAVMLGLWLLDGISSMVSSPFVQMIFSSLSVSQRYSEFTMGLFDVSNVLFFLSIIAVFIFFTIRVFEKRRWS
ncbi:MAG: ABC transporter permease subunit [Acetanaerobacterium sp.]